MNDEKKNEEVKSDEVKPESDQNEGFTPEDFDKGPDTVGKAEEERQVGEPTIEDEESYNLDDIDINTPDFEPLPIGWYLCTITNVKWSTSKAGDPMMIIEFTVTDEKYPQFKGRRVSQFCLFKYNNNVNDPVAEMGRKRFRKSMVRAGINIDWKTFSPKSFVQRGEALGKQLRVRFGKGDPYENSEGQMAVSNNVKDCKSVGSGDAFLSDSP